MQIKSWHIALLGFIPFVIYIYFALSKYGSQDGVFTLLSFSIFIIFLFLLGNLASSNEKYKKDGAIVSIIIGIIGVIFIPFFLPLIIAGVYQLQNKNVNINTNIDIAKLIVSIKKLLVDIKNAIISFFWQDYK